MIVWCDTETTGLDERQHHLLEVAFVVTDDALVERAATSVVVKPVGVDVDQVDMPLVVREMHEKSGLLEDLAGGSRRHEGELFLIGWLGGVFGRAEDLRKVPLAGSTISFDRRWLRAHMPALEALFSHRSIDVSSISELAARWAPSVHASRPQDKSQAHRALTDARASIALLRHFRLQRFIGSET